MTPSEEILARYKETAKEADSMGRVITVGRLRVSQQVRVSEMTPGLDGETSIPMPDGSVVTIPRRSIPMVAAMVRAIDDKLLMFPSNRAILDSTMDILDEPGIAAAIKAVSKLNASSAPAAANTDEGASSQ